MTKPLRTRLIARLHILARKEAGLEEDDRSCYLDAEGRAAAIEELEALSAAPGGGGTRRQADAAPVLLDFVRLLNAHLDAESLLPRVVDFAIELTGADRGCLILFDHELTTYLDLDLLASRGVLQRPRLGLRSKEHTDRARHFVGGGQGRIGHNSGRVGYQPFDRLCG